MNATPRTAVIALALCLLVKASLCLAAEEEAKSTGLPLPRFASLRSGEVNMRSGPGFRYPIRWVYKRRGLPVEILAEYDFWRRVRDSEGAEGWIHKNELTGKRAGIVTGTARALRDAPQDSAALVAHVEEGVTGQVVSCALDWCKLKFEDAKGYLRKTDFWGAYPSEKFD